jgi:hypothetical protein
MEFQGFEIKPRPNILIGIENQRIVGRILESQNILKYLPKTKVYEVTVGPEINDSTPLPKAHGNWKSEYFQKIKGVDNLPQKSLDSVCPAGCILATIDCVNKRHQGMGSHYGYSGYFVSLIILKTDLLIWDTRIEVAS